MPAPLPVETCSLWDGQPGGHGPLAQSKALRGAPEAGGKVARWGGR